MPILLNSLNFPKLLLSLCLILFGFKVYFLNISPLIRRKKLIIFLKKINIIWYDYEEHVSCFEHYFFLNSQKFSKDICRESVNKFFKKQIKSFIKNNFVKEAYFQKVLEKNIYPLVRDHLEVLEVAYLIKKKTKKRF